jgi:DNA (cytosine-5)-methyltransferase 1
VRVLDLFSGIGGFSLGLERAGMRTVAFCEIDPYCRAVLRKHWPDVPCFSDVRDLHAYDVGPVDVICGGFPCQDISHAGRQAGLAGERSGLWSEYRRLIEECRPSWVVIENVSALRSNGLDQVLGEISALGYDAEWHCIPAAAVGAPHRRDRIWIVAYPSGGTSRQDGQALSGERSGGFPREAGERRTWGLGGGGGSPGDVAHADSSGLEGWNSGIVQERPGEQPARQSGSLPDADDQVQSDVPVDALPRLRLPELERYGCGAWVAEPDVGRVANGVPARVDRLRALGNAVVPQVVQAIGEAIMSAQTKVAAPQDKTLSRVCREPAVAAPSCGGDEEQSG